MRIRKARCPVAADLCLRNQLSAFGANLPYQSSGVARQSCRRAEADFEMRTMICWHGWTIITASLFLGTGVAAAPAHRNIAQESMSSAPADTAGHYSVLRDGGKDTGCMLTLYNQQRAGDGARAFLAPGCRDQGIVIFDPASWQLINGRLVLTARKGHKAHLDPQPDGTWKKDPKEGKTLSLKKL
jgi:Protease inhibitor Inh